MANKIQSLALIASVICFLSLISDAHAAESPYFQVQGTVYCDPCRAKFVTRLSERIPGAKVKLECHNITDGRVTYSVDSETDNNGIYQLIVNGDHEDEICGVKPVKSSRDDCNEIIADGWAKEFTRVTLTTKNGIIGNCRKVNPILYMKSKPIAECGEVFQELHYIPTDDMEQP